MPPAAPPLLAATPRRRGAAALGSGSVRGSVPGCPSGIWVRSCSPEICKRTRRLGGQQEEAGGRAPSPKKKQPWSPARKKGAARSRACWRGTAERRPASGDTWRPPEECPPAGKKDTTSAPGSEGKKQQFLSSPRLLTLRGSSQPWAWHLLRSWCWVARAQHPQFEPSTPSSSPAPPACTAAASAGAEPGTTGPRQVKKAAGCPPVRQPCLCTTGQEGFCARSPALIPARGKGTSPRA